MHVARWRILGPAALLRCGALVCAMAVFWRVARSCGGDCRRTISRAGGRLLHGRVPGVHGHAPSTATAGRLGTRWTPASSARHGWIDDSIRFSMPTFPHRSGRLQEPTRQEVVVPESVARAMGSQGHAPHARIRSCACGTNRRRGWWRSRPASGRIISTNGLPFPAATGFGGKDF